MIERRKEGRKEKEREEVSVHAPHSVHSSVK
jgi:hypothetical protein